MKADCELIVDSSTSPPTMRCRRCSNKLRTDHPVESIRMNCKAMPRLSLQCKHMRPVAVLLGAKQCQTCAGKVMVKVYFCGMHGECTVQKPLDGVACCEGCKDYSPAESNAAAFPG